MNNTTTTTVRLQLTVTYDPAITDAETVASNAINLLETALSTPGILDEIGNPEFSDFQVVE